MNTGKRRIKMADLRQVLTDAGVRDVGTHIASGNVIFSSDGLPARATIEDPIEEEFGFLSEAFIRSEAETRDVLARVPWDAEQYLLEVSFLLDTPDPVDARRLEALVEEPEGLVVSGREVFYRREGKGIETVHKETTTIKTLNRLTTRRGVNTVLQIVEKYFD